MIQRYGQPRKGNNDKTISGAAVAAVVSDNNSDTNAEIKLLEAEVAALTVENELLQTEVDTLTVRVEELEQEIADLTPVPE